MVKDRQTGRQAGLERERERDKGQKRESPESLPLLLRSFFFPAWGFLYLSVGGRLVSWLAGPVPVRLT